jgi:hypothetical protein
MCRDIDRRTGLGPSGKGRQRDAGTNDPPGGESRLRFLALERLWSRRIAGRKNRTGRSRRTDGSPLVPPSNPTVEPLPRRLTNLLWTYPHPTGQRFWRGWPPVSDLWLIVQSAKVRTTQEVVEGRRQSNGAACEQDAVRRRPATRDGCRGVCRSLAEDLALRRRHRRQEIRGTAFTLQRSDDSLSSPWEDRPTRATGNDRPCIPPFAIEARGQCTSPGASPDRRHMLSGLNGATSVIPRSPEVEPCIGIGRMLPD